MKIFLVEATESGAEPMTRRRVLKLLATAYSWPAAGRAVAGVFEGKRDLLKMVIVHE
jgi:hypothetical protein